jgi:ABC-type transport system substrate-binding protein
MGPDGEAVRPLEIITPTSEYDNCRAQIGLAISKWLKEIGLEVELKQFPISDIIRKMSSQDFDTMILGWDLPLGPYYLSTLFHSRNAVKGGFNIFGYKNPQFDELIEMERKEADREKRKKLVFRAQQIIARDMPCLPLYNKKMIEAYRKDRFEGWVDMLGGIMNRWSFYRLHRVDADGQ